MVPTDERLLVERESLAGLAMSISYILTGATSLHHILQQCAESLVWHLGAAFARIWLLDEPQDVLILAASAGLSTNLHGEYSRVPVATSLKIGSIVRDRRPRLTNRLQEETWVRHAAWAKRERLVVYAGYPLIAQDRVVGVMAIFSRHQLGGRTLDELTAIAGGIAQCVIRSHAEEALRANQERLALAVEGAEMALWDWDLQSDAMVWSNQLFSLFGYHPSEVLPSWPAWQARVFPDDLNRLLEELDRSRNQKSVLNLDYRVSRADSGESAWIASRGKYFYDKSGRPVRLIGALFNINHRKRAEAEIERLLEAARMHERELREKQAQLVQTAKLASIGEFATGLAHELNNPLNNIGLVIGNALDVIAEEVTGPPKVRLISNLKLAMEQVNRGAAIINHLRVFARTGKENFQPVNINRIIADAWRFVGERMRLAGIEGVMQLDSRSSLVDGCQIQLEQVLVNLLTNAIDAVKDAVAKEIFVSSQVKDHEVLICVKDTAMGIAADNLMRIFDPFFTTKDVGLGTGLGLSIAFGIVKEHHGEIAVKSTVGQRTEFTIRIPLSKTLNDWPS